LELIGNIWGQKSQWRVGIQDGIQGYGAIVGHILPISEARGKNDQRSS
jgi:hypothetical protein